MTNMHVDPLTPQETAGIRQLLDRAEIWECLMRYARGVDRLDEQLVNSAFWEDAHDAHGGFNGSPRDFMQWVKASQPGRDVAQHMLGSHSLTITGPDEARSETYFLSFGKLQGSDELAMLGGRYDDEWQRRDGHWRLSARLVIMDWRATADAAGMTDHLATWHRGARSTDDPTYSARVERRTEVAN